MNFINREEEIKFLESHFKNLPNSLLFVYGPKSSGKSALLAKVVEDLDKNKYAINYLSLRSVIIYNFKTFLNVFFPKNIRNKAKDILSGITLNAGFFSVKVEEESILEENAFKLLVDKLASANRRGIQPIIIIDEIQLLKHIYINGERYLIDELFNLFIEITKVKHLAHVVLATSDSYFIDEIYNSAKLAKTSDFFLLNHFDMKTVYDWLTKENFTEKEIEAVWHYVGGCPWEIMEIINKKKIVNDIKDICLSFVETNYRKVSDYIYPFDKDKEKTFYQVINEIITKGYCKKENIDNRICLIELLKEMIEHDFWFYDVKQGKITANSQSIYLSFERMLNKR